MMTCIGIEKDIHARILKALQHPDNILGQAALLTSLVIPEGDEITRSFYLNTVVPTAIEFYDPIRFLEPAVGSGIMILAHASSTSLAFALSAKALLLFTTSCKTVNASLF